MINTCASRYSEVDKVPVLSCSVLGLRRGAVGSGIFFRLNPKTRGGGAGSLASFLLNLTFA